MAMYTALEVVSQQVQHFQSSIPDSGTYADQWSNLFVYGKSLSVPSKLDKGNKMQEGA